MLWGLGTGRCGTHSLAREIGGEHERNRPTMVHTARVALGDRVHEAEVREHIKDVLRGDMGQVNLHYVPVLPLILELDPEPYFIWVWRDYVDVMQSQLQPGHSYWKLNARDWTEFMYPFNEWEHLPDYAREEKGLWYWTAVNTEILRYMMLVERSTWHILHCNQLKYRDATGNPIPSGTALYLEDRSDPLAALMEDMYVTNTDPDLASFVSRVQGASYGDQETE